MTSDFISITLDGVTSFSASKTHEIDVNAPITVKVLGRISFHAMAENWKHLKDTFALSSYLNIRFETESCLQVICFPIYHLLEVSRQ